MIQINLLPWREQARKNKQNRFALVVGMAAAFGFFVTFIFHMHYSSRITEQQKRNIILQQALDEESINLGTLNKKKRDLIDVRDQLHFVYALRESSYRAVRLLNELVIANPEGVTLYKIVRAGDAVSIFGKAKSNLQITMFMESLEKSNYFKQPDLTEISGKEGQAGEERIFQIKLEQQG
jgi:type IV pilus assembly protein PilN